MLRPHIVDGEFQSDKYPTTPRGKVPLSVKDETAQDLLWQYAQRRRIVDEQFADDLEFALVDAGYKPVEHRRRTEVEWFADAMEAKLKKNDHKAHWEGMAPDDLLRRLHQEVSELRTEVVGWSQERFVTAGERVRRRVLAEAADVANFALMIADVCARGLRL